MVADDLFGTPLDQAEIDFENEGGETYICGNPPYKRGFGTTRPSTGGSHRNECASRGRDYNQVAMRSTTGTKSGRT
jgi:hypothetical protein